MKYLAILSAILLVTLGTFVDARIGSEKIVAHREAETIVDIAQDRSQLAHRELKVCRRGDSEFKKRGGADQKAECSKARRCYRRKKQCSYNGNRCRHVAQCKRRCNDKC
mmetsp:Transcript_33069/g.97564  ORF Transcript_33069/g.97564 Transcript_33069/m.97564 type:complete len:109 (-) Transcript_33069:248-574(-)